MAASPSALAWGLDASSADLKTQAHRSRL